MDKALIVVRAKLDQIRDAQLSVFQPAPSHTSRPFSAGKLEAAPGTQRHVAFNNKLHAAGAEGTLRKSCRRRATRERPMQRSLGLPTPQQQQQRQGMTGARCHAVQRLHQRSRAVLGLPALRPRSRVLPINNSWHDTGAVRGEGVSGGGGKITGCNMWSAAARLEGSQAWHQDHTHVLQHLVSSKGPASE